MPVVWETRYGEGRGFYSSLGGVAAGFEAAPMRTILARRQPGRLGEPGEYYFKKNNRPELGHNWI